MMLAERWRKIIDQNVQRITNLNELIHILLARLQFLIFLGLEIL